MRPFHLFLLRYIGPVLVGWLIYKASGNSYLGWAASLFHLCIGELIYANIVSSITGSIVGGAVSSVLGKHWRT